MSLMKDYSGKFKPDLQLRDFSEDALRRLWKVGGDLYTGFQELWVEAIKEKFGEQTAIELSGRVWMGKPKTERKGFKLRGNENGTERQVRVTREAFNIMGDDVESLFKQLQVDCTMGPNVEAEFDLKDKNHGIYTVIKCPYLDQLWEAGDDVMQKHVCEELDGLGFELTAHQYNPKMQAIPLKLPVKGSKIACQWEFKIE